MEPDEFSEVDIREMDEWKARNQREREEMLRQYAEWLRERGVLVNGPKARPRPARR